MEELKPMQMQMVYPDHKIFLNGSVKALDQVKNNTPIFWLERIDYPKAGGIHLFYHGRLQPTKGFVFPEAIVALNQAKAILKSYLEVGKMWVALPGVIGLCLIPHKYRMRTLSRILDTVIRSFHYLVQPFLLHENYYTEVARGVREITKKTLFDYGFVSESANPHDLADKMADILGAIIEYDNSYRFRLQDILTETNKELLQSPRKEILRILKIGLEREHDIKSFYKLIYTFASVLLVSPKFCKVFKKAIKDVDIESMKLDAIDSYNILMRSGYDFNGQDQDTRVAKYLKMHDGKIPPMFLIK